MTWLLDQLKTRYTPDHGVSAETKTWHALRQGLLPVQPDLILICKWIKMLFSAEWRPKLIIVAEQQRKGLNGRKLWQNFIRICLQAKLRANYTHRVTYVSRFYCRLCVRVCIGFFVCVSVRVCVFVCVYVCKMPLLAPYVWLDMDAVSAANGSTTPEDDDYKKNAGANLLFEGLNFPEDPIRLLSVQVEVST